MNLTEHLSDRILLSNQQFVVVNKRGGESSMDDKLQGRSLQHKVKSYCKHPVHVVNRLDEPVSGLVLFAKNEKAMQSLSSQFSARNVRKSYLTAVSKIDIDQEGVFEDYISINKKINKAFQATKSDADSRHCALNYKLIGSGERYHFFWIQPHTGRQHQTRFQLAMRGLHVKGDVKYGTRRKNDDRAIHLHAWELAFNHPISTERTNVRSGAIAE